MKALKLVLDIDELPDAGLIIRGELPAEWLGDSVLDAYEAAAPLRVDLEVRKVNESIYVQGSLEVSLTFACSRTLAPGRAELKVPVSELYQPAALHALSLGTDVEADDLDKDEPYVYEHGRVDLEPLLREQLVLAQEPFPTVVSTPDGDDDAVLWSSGADEIDPRWAKLKDIKLG